MFVQKLTRNFKNFCVSLIDDEIVHMVFLSVFMLMAGRPGRNMPVDDRGLDKKPGVE